MQPIDVLKKYFGYDQFREGQEYLIEQILSGKDVLGIMPTGAGKSLCFQVPALIFGGISLVVSPLISLMKDQVFSLTQAGIPAAFINSSLTERQIGLVMNHAASGKYKIIYVAPERLESWDFVQLARTVKLSMLTVDEAHCISQWGQDFRPSYLKIPEFMDKLGYRPVLSAFTATATPKVQEDIVSLLRLADPSVLVTGFDRKNLYFEVRKPRNKLAALQEILSQRKESFGIIYCATRSNVDEVCAWLKEQGFKAAAYHAGLSDEERRTNQDDFIFDRVHIMVATNAFGMGIDKSNISYVVHYNMPKNIESYYQEAGRAGRDGEPADCILLYGPGDIRTNQYLIDNSRDMLFPELERQRLKEMTYYCHENDCLRSYILKYFGENPPGHCGNCGNCKAEYETIDATTEAQKLLSCVVRLKERFGLKILIDVLRGSKGERIKAAGLDKLSTYGISEWSESRLRDLAYYLAKNEYLATTNDEYPLVKLTAKAGGVLRGNEKIFFKINKEREKEAEKKTAYEKRFKENVPFNPRLFEQLKALRLEIANEERVPAYIIFADSSLTDMCLKMPHDKEELLHVSGVGQVKLEKYGERFLKLIQEFEEAGKNGSLDGMNDSNECESERLNDHASCEMIGSGGITHEANSYDGTDALADDELVTINRVTDQINCILLQKGMKKTTGAKLNEWLLEQGYLQVETIHGKSFKVPSVKGLEAGIVCQEREIRGEMCMINLYGKEQQKFLLESNL